MTHSSQSTQPAKLAHLSAHVRGFVLQNGRHFLGGGEGGGEGEVGGGEGGYGGGEGEGGGGEGSGGEGGGAKVVEYTAADHEPPSE